MLPSGLRSASGGPQFGPKAVLSPRLIASFRLTASFRLGTILGTARIKETPKTQRGGERERERDRGRGRERDIVIGHHAPPPSRWAEYARCARVPQSASTPCARLNRPVRASCALSARACAQQCMFTLIRDAAALAGSCGFLRVACSSLAQRMGPQRSGLS
eukprot:15435108-Alexandrium_andersonii.AAC.1